MEQYLEPLEDAVTNYLLPSIFGSNISDQQRELYSLPIKHGGLGISNIVERATSEYQASRQINASLIAIMMVQGNDLPSEEERENVIKHQKKEKFVALKKKVDTIEKSIPKDTLRVLEQTNQPGASNWLSVLPLQEHGFVLNKREFRDALSLRYNLPIKGLPSQYPCGQKFNVTHAMNCKRGGFISMRHNNIRDFQANLLTKVCKDVEVEPPLQPVTEERLTASTLIGDEARPDVRARGFWRNGQNAYFDIRVTNADAESQRSVDIKKVLSKHEKEKKRHYNNRIMNIEQGTFTPLIYTIHGGMGPECAAFHKNIAEKIAYKTDAKVQTFIRCKLSFIIIRSALLCLRGSRSIKASNLVNIDSDFNLNCDKVKL